MQCRHLAVVMLLSLCCCCAVATPTCTAGESKFVMTSINGGQQCPSTELAVIWPFIIINQTADCNYTYSGLVGSPYVYPVTFAQVTYPTRAGSSRPYVKFASTTNSAQAASIGSNEYVVNKMIQGASEEWVQQTFHRPATLEGFLAAWTYSGLPIIFEGPFGPQTNTPGNYTAKATGHSSFLLTSKQTGCSFSYRIVSGGFAGFKPTECTEGRDADCPAAGGSCGPGKYLQNNPGSSYVCALCPAGTYSADGRSASCSKCTGQTAAPKAAATSCVACGSPLVSSYQGSGATACVDQCDKQATYDLPTWGMNVVYRNGQACDASVCPNGSVATPNNECIAAQNGQLCIAVAAAGSTCASGKPASTDTQQQSSKGTEGWGGAVLQLDTADMTAAVCKTGVTKLAQWLADKQTWLGFNYTAWGANFAPGTGLAPVFGLQWQVLGPLKGSNLRQYPRCGLAHGGPGPLPMLTQGSGTVLDTTAFVFQSILKTEPPAGSSLIYDTTTWRILVSKGADSRHIKTVWFRDGSVGQCPSVTSLTVRETAGGDLAAGSCQLNFKVVSGSILGAAAANTTPCSSGTYAVKHPQGTTSCVACAPGSAVAADGKSCTECTGNSFSDVWGAKECVACDNPDYDHAYCYSKPTDI